MRYFRILFNMTACVGGRAKKKDRNSPHSCVPERNGVVRFYKPRVADGENGNGCGGGGGGGGVRVTINHLFGSSLPPLATTCTRVRP